MSSSAATLKRLPLLKEDESLFGLKPAINLIASISIASAGSTATYKEQSISSGDTSSLETNLHVPAGEKQVYIVNKNQKIISPVTLHKNELRWRGYLNNLLSISNNHFNSNFVSLLVKVRKQLHNFLGAPIAPPDVSEGEDGGLQLVWERGNLFLSVDVIAPQNIEWFLKNKTTGKYWGAEGLDISDFPPNDLQKQLRSQNFS